VARRPTPVDAKSYGQMEFIYLILKNKQKMKTQKMSLARIQGKLSRAEMKDIMAGSGIPSCGCTTFSPLCSHTGYCINSTGHCCKKFA
jgi:hypothetical protein